MNQKKGISRDTPTTPVPKQRKRRGLLLTFHGGCGVWSVGVGVGHAHHSRILRGENGAAGQSVVVVGGSGYLEYCNPTVRLGRDRRAGWGGG